MRRHSSAGLPLESCGCFGTLLAQPLRWWVLVEDVELIALALLTYRAVSRARLRKRALAYERGSEAMRSQDLVVIGGGATGLAAARAGVRGGARVLLVHDGPIGGDCTFTGCVPSKTLIEASHRGLGFRDATRAVARTIEQIAAAETPEVLHR